MRYIKMTKNDIANGPGVRVTLWVSGCSLHCKSCHNPQTQDFNSGKLFNDDAKQELFEALDNPYIQGLTLSGGHPLEPESVKVVYLLIKEVNEKFPQKDVWLYTGYTWEQIFPTIVTDDFNIYRFYQQGIIEMCDVVVDGPYIEELRDISLPYCGSKNQRLIDVQETFKQGKVIQYKINK